MVISFPFASSDQNVSLQGKPPKEFLLGGEILCIVPTVHPPLQIVKVILV